MKISKEKLNQKLEEVAKMALSSKWKRLFHNPYKYINAILFRELIYKKKKKEKYVQSNAFFGLEMNMLLPSSMDIYLTGGKTHISEIRLAKFLIQNLDEGDTFLDVGAHYGYFSLLASQLVGNKGKVVSFEASPTTFGVLDKNKTLVKNLYHYNLAVSNTNSKLIFYEFPNLYSEYNTLDISQFENEKWFVDYPPKEVEIETIWLDNFLEKEKYHPKIIKIDVEGAEYQVLQGAQKHLEENNPIIAMEYLSSERGNEEHLKAEKFLNSYGFASYSIDNEGKIKETKNILQHLKENGLDSDNIIFVKNRTNTKN